MYPSRMGFYHGSSEPPEEKGSGGLKETVLITAAVFKVLALPLGIIFGGIIGLVVLFWLFTISGWAGLAALVAIAVGLVGFGIWEYRHPPELK